jgi:hypothetical protein
MVVIIIPQLQSLINTSKKNILTLKHIHKCYSKIDSHEEKKNG